VWESIWHQLQERRAERLTELGKDPSPEVVSSQMINTLLGKIDAQLRELAGEAYASPEADIPPVWDHFLNPTPPNKWAEGLSPPFPIQAFANPAKLHQARESYARAVRLEIEAEERAGA